MKAPTLFDSLPWGGTYINSSDDSMVTEHAKTNKPMTGRTLENHLKFYFRPNTMLLLNNNSDKYMFHMHSTFCVIMDHKYLKSSGLLVR